MRDQGNEVELFLDRGDVLIFRGDAIHGGAEAPFGHFGRVHVYIDSERIIHNAKTHFGSCGTLVASRRSKRVKLVKRSKA